MPGPNEQGVLDYMAQKIASGEKTLDDVRPEYRARLRAYMAMQRREAMQTLPTPAEPSPPPQSIPEQIAGHLKGAAALAGQVGAGALREIGTGYGLAGKLVREHGLGLVAPPGSYFPETIGRVGERTGLGVTYGLAQPVEEYTRKFTHPTAATVANIAGGIAPYLLGGEVLAPLAGAAGIGEGAGVLARGARLLSRIPKPPAFLRTPLRAGAEAALFETGQQAVRGRSRTLSTDEKRELMRGMIHQEVDWSTLPFGESVQMYDFQKSLAQGGARGKAAAGNIPELRALVPETAQKTPDTFLDRLAHVNPILVSAIGGLALGTGMEAMSHLRALRALPGAQRFHVKRTGVAPYEDPGFGPTPTTWRTEAGEEIPISDAARQRFELQRQYLQAKYGRPMREPAPAAEPMPTLYMHDEEVPISDAARQRLELQRLAGMQEAGVTARPAGEPQGLRRGEVPGPITAGAQVHPAIAAIEDLARRAGSPVTPSAGAQVRPDLEALQRRAGVQMAPSEVVPRSPVAEDRQVIDFTYKKRDFRALVTDDGRVTFVTRSEAGVWEPARASPQTLLRSLRQKEPHLFVEIEAAQKRVRLTPRQERFVADNPTYERATVAKMTPQEMQDIQSLTRQQKQFLIDYPTSDPKDVAKMGNEELLRQRVVLRRATRAAAPEITPREPYTGDVPQPPRGVPVTEGRVGADIPDPLDPFAARPVVPPLVTPEADLARLTRRQAAFLAANRALYDRATVAAMTPTKLTEEAAKILAARRAGRAVAPELVPREPFVGEPVDVGPRPSVFPPGGFEVEAARARAAAAFPYPAGAGEPPAPTRLARGVSMKPGDTIFMRKGDGFVPLTVQSSERGKLTALTPTGLPVTGPSERFYVGSLADQIAERLPHPGATLELKMPVGQFAPGMQFEYVDDVRGPTGSIIARMVRPKGLPTAQPIRVTPAQFRDYFGQFAVRPTTTPTASPQTGQGATIAAGAGLSRITPAGKALYDMSPRESEFLSDIRNASQLLNEQRGRPRGALMDFERIHKQLSGKYTREAFTRLVDELNNTLDPNLIQIHPSRGSEPMHRQFRMVGNEYISPRGHTPPDVAKAAREGTVSSRSYYGISFPMEAEGGLAAGAGGITPAGKALYDMSPRELDDFIQSDKAKEAALTSDVFGSEGGKRYDALQRAANNPYDMQGADAASKEIANMESRLTRAQQEKLFGIGESGPTWTDARDFASALNGLDWSSPIALGDSLKYAVTQVGEKSNPALMTHGEQVAYSQIRHAYEQAKAMGWDTGQVSESAFRGVGQRFRDPQDARFMLDRFMSGKSGATEEGLVSLGGGLPPLAGPGIGGAAGAAAPVSGTPEEQEEERRHNILMGALVAGGAIALPLIVRHITRNLPTRVVRSIEQAAQRSVSDADGTLAEAIRDLPQRGWEKVEGTKDTFENFFSKYLTATEEQVRRKGGQVGITLADRVNLGRKRGEQAHGTITKGFRELFADLTPTEKRNAPKSLGWMNETQGQFSVRPGARGLPVEVPANASPELRRLTQFTQDAGNAGVAWGGGVREPDYFPRNVNYPDVLRLLDSPEGRQAIEDAMMSQHGRKLALMRSTPKDQIQSMFDLSRKPEFRLHPRAHYGRLDYEREWKLLPDWVIDPETGKRVDLVGRGNDVEEWIDHMHRLLVTSSMYQEFRPFDPATGQRVNVIDQLVDSLPDNMARDKHDLRVLMYTGLNGRTPDPSVSMRLMGPGTGQEITGMAIPLESEWASGLLSLNAARSIGVLSGVKHFTQAAAQLSADFGLSNVPRGVLAAVSERIPVFREAGTQMIRWLPSMRDLADLPGEQSALESGALAAASKRTYASAGLGYRGPTLKYIRKVVDWAPGLRSVRWFFEMSRATGAYAGLLDTNLALRGAQKAFRRTRVIDQSLYDKLINRGILNARELITEGGALGREQVLSVMYDGAESVARADAWNKAPWMSGNAFARALGQFSNFGFSSAVLSRRVVTRALESGDYRPVIRYLVGGSIIGATYLAMHDVMSGKPLGENWGWRMLEEIPQIGLIHRALQGYGVPPYASGLRDVMNVGQGRMHGVTRDVVNVGAGLGIMVPSGHRTANPTMPVAPP